MHFWTAAADAQPGLPRVVRAAINVANSFKISTCSWLLWRPRSRARLSLPNGFLCMSISAVATRLLNHTKETHLFNKISLVYVSNDLLGNLAHDCVEFWLNAQYLLWIDFFCLDRSYSASWVSRPRVLIAQQLLIDCARYQRMIVRTRFYQMHCTLRRRYFGRIIIGKIPCDDAVKCCTFDIIKWCTTHQIFVCMCLRLNQWSSCSLNRFLKLIIYFLKMRLFWDGESCTQRCRIQVPSHDSPPHFWLFHFCLNASHDDLRVFKGTAVSLLLDGC